MMLVSTNGQGSCSELSLWRFGGEMDDDVGIGDELVDQLGVADIACNEFDLIEYWRQVIGVTGIG